MCLSFVAAIAACGGVDRASAPGPVVDAGVEAGSPLSVGPSEADPCAAAQKFEYTPLANFDEDATKPQLAGPFATYISYDGTGNLYWPLTATSETLLFSNIAPTLCDNCVDGPDGGTCATCSCISGYTYASGSPAEKAPTPLCGSTAGFALHLHANAPGGLSHWGMNVGIDLRQNCTGLGDGALTGSNGPCYFDARDWTGVSFWALLEPGSSGVSGLATVADKATAGVLGGAYPDNELVCGNLPCLGDAPNDDRCTATSMPLCLCDPFGTAVGFNTGQWTFYAIPFSEMRQKGYGAPVDQLDIAHLLGFKISLGQGNWDVWVDNVSFYRPKGD